MPRLLLALTMLAAIACKDQPSPEAAPPESGAPDISRMTFTPALGVDISAMTATPRGVWIRDLTMGTGDPAGPGTEVSIHYDGRLPAGTQFDSNGPAEVPFTFRIDAGDVVPGFDEGVRGMRVGGKRLVVIPPALGYGAQANGPIPANSVLVFTIDLVSAR